MSAMNLGPMPEPVYYDKCYVVSMQFSLYKAGKPQIIGLYNDRSLANKVKDAVYSHFMMRTRGGVELAVRECGAKIKKVEGRWRFIDPVETSWNIGTIFARIRSLTEYAKTIALKVIDADGERFVKLFIDLPPPTAKRKAEPAEDPEPKRQKLDPKAELIKLGFGNFDDKKGLRAAYKAWVLQNHPDKVSAGDERQKAEERYRAMQANYETLMGEDESDCKDS